MLLIKTLYLFLFLFISIPQVCNAQKIIELPIETVNGYGGFTRWTSTLEWNTIYPGIWSKFRIETKGLPSHWIKSNVIMEILDHDQFFFQNLKQGKITSEEFNHLVEGYDMQIVPSKLTDKPIDCFIHLAIGKTETGAIEYIIDTNNNLDFSDEKIHIPLPEMYKITDTHIQNAFPVNYQLYLNDKVSDLTMDVIVSNSKNPEKDGLKYNFPHHYRAYLNGKPIYISSWFRGPAISKSSIRLTIEQSENPFDAFEKNTIFDFYGKKYKNLGIDLEKNVLKLEEVEEKKIIYSETPGFYLNPFENLKAFQSEKTISLQDYKGQLLYVEFWGSWCRPCLEEIPFLINAYNNTNRKEVSFLGIAFDESPQTLKRVIDKYDLPWDQVLDKNNELKKSYNVTGAPTSFLIDKEGKIIAKNIRGEQLLETIKNALKKP